MIDPRQQFTPFRLLSAMGMDDLPRARTGHLWRCTCPPKRVAVNRERTRFDWRDVCSGACKPTVREFRRVARREWALR